jgi:hypothetical protein
MKRAWEIIFGVVMVGAIIISWSVAGILWATTDWEPAWFWQNEPAHSGPPAEYSEYEEYGDLCDPRAPYPC